MATTSVIAGGLTPRAEELAIMTPEQRAEHKRNAVFAVFGQDVKFDRNGRPIEQGIGSPGNESVNHFLAIEKYQGASASTAAKIAANKRAGFEKFPVNK